jgi:P-type E1-E2 ATPase
METSMIEIDVPGFRTFRFRNLVLDVNGTIAKDGELIEGVAGLLKELQLKLNLHLITADTHGKQAEIDRMLGMKAVAIPRTDQAQTKLHYVEQLGADEVAAIGNGANDAAMLGRAALGIAIIGSEGAAVEAVLNAKVVAPDIRAALEMLLYPKRLIATLRR